MNLNLKNIQNWTELAREANWSVLKLSKKCHVSVRTLQRYFLKQMGKNPQAWLAEQRQIQAYQLLRESFSVKEAAACLGYKQATNFSRKFKKHWGCSPTGRRRKSGL